MPCTNCAKSLIAAGVTEIVIFSDYHDTHAEEFFEIAQIPIKRIQMPDKIIRYDIKSFSSAKEFEA
jgi:deoxycytidylate deaminase